METAQDKTKYRPWKLDSLQPQQYDFIHVNRWFNRSCNWKFAVILLTMYNIVIFLLFITVTGCDSCWITFVICFN